MLNHGGAYADNLLMRRLDRPGLGTWLASTTGVGGIVAATSLGPMSEATWVSPTALFSLVVVAASLCALASVGAVVVAHRDDTPEIGLMGGGLLALSTLGLAHGIAVPGVLYGENDAVMATAILSVPSLLVAAAPLLAPRTRWARRASACWRRWVGAWSAGAISIAVTLLVFPNAVAVPPPRDTVTICAAAGSLLAMLMLSWRQLRLYWVGEVRATLVGSVGLAFIGVTTVEWVGERPFSTGFWLVHLLDTVGVLAATASIAFGHRAGRRVTEILTPILARDPLAALEARIIAAADAYDAIAQTRHYRDGLGHETAAGVLEEHAGSQWDADIVRVLIDVARDPATGSAFDRIGREHESDQAAAVVCGCVDALPAEVAELLATLSR